VRTKTTKRAYPKAAEKKKKEKKDQSKTQVNMVFASQKQNRHQKKG